MKRTSGGANLELNLPFDFAARPLFASLAEFFSPRRLILGFRLCNWAATDTFGKT